MTLIKDKETEFVDLCHSHNVNKIYAFGSSITDHFDPIKSDIDLVVKSGISDPTDRGEILLSLWDKLEAFFQRNADLLTEDSIKYPYQKSTIDRTKKLIYDRKRKKFLSDMTNFIELIFAFTKDFKSKKILLTPTT